MDWKRKEEESRWVKGNLGKIPKSKYSNEIELTKTGPIIATLQRLLPLLMGKTI